MWTIEGEGVSQMTILLHNAYLVKVATKGEGAKKSQKNCPRSLWMAPIDIFSRHFLQDSFM